MAKRSACSVSCKNLVTKNVKVNDSSDFWEDDLDEDAIDDCFKKATQVLNECSIDPSTE